MSLLACAATLCLAVGGDQPVVAATATAAAHPFHVSHAELEVNRQTGLLEVGMVVDITDLERVLSLRAGKVVRLDTGKDAEAAARVDKLIQEYLGITFRVTRADGKVAPFQWVGKELEVHGVWLFFTCDLGAAGKQQGITGVKVTHQVLCDLDPRQMNNVTCRDGGWRRSFVLTRTAPSRTVRGVAPRKESEAPRPDSPGERDSRGEPGSRG